ncbi:MAG: hypothetical protein MOIL_00865 [Candidatus Methanolliviera sp. GoM_oil]|nr:MAG: hypothetical protein MOIL_00865 [Candidatus Methanolliviera sp. GoM_oil]
MTKGALNTTKRSIKEIISKIAEKELEERREIKDFFIQEVFEKDEVLYG